MAEVLDRPSFTIPQSSVDIFARQHRSDSGLRVGQAFHQYFNLERMTQDRAFCDRLYQADGSKAWAMVREITDPQN